MRYIIESNLSWKDLHALIHAADKGKGVTVLTAEHALFLVDVPNCNTRLFYAAEHGEDGLNHLHEIAEAGWIDFNAVHNHLCPVCLQPLIPQEQYDVCHCGACGFTWDSDGMHFTKVTRTVSADGKVVKKDL